MLITGEKIFADQAIKIIGEERERRFEAVEIHYTHACIATELPDFNMANKHFNKAMEYYNEMIAAGLPLENYEYVLWGGIANALNGLGRDEEAERIYIKALKLKPASKKWSAYEVNIARCMVAQGKLEEAETRLLDFVKRRAKVFGVDDTEDYLSVFV